MLYSAVLVLATTTAGSDIKRDEVVVFFPTYAHSDRNGKTWSVRVHGWIFEPENNSLRRSAAVAALKQAMRVPAGKAEQDRFDRRVRRFLVDNERNKKISVRLGTGDYGLSPSKKNGHFKGTLKLPAGSIQSLRKKQIKREGWLIFTAVMRENDDRRFFGRVQLIADRGLSIISDIDDTVKDSNVRDRRELLANTFYRKPRAVAGMPQLYRSCAERGVRFHYVSGSPWQLSEPISAFFSGEKIPPGSMHMKDFRLTDKTALEMLSSQEETKLKAIRAILRDFPQRKFTLIGDSGEQDPEIYGKIAREFPRQVVGTYIRLVPKAENGDARFREAFRDIPQEKWKVFSRPQDLKPALDSLIKRHGSGS